MLVDNLFTIDLIVPVVLYKDCKYNNFWIHCPTNQESGGKWFWWSPSPRKWCDGGYPVHEIQDSLLVPCWPLEFLTITGYTFASTIEKYFGLKQKGKGDYYEDEEKIEDTV
jgi:hypothetical protein